jgi:putative superfamily III holin-X
MANHSSPGSEASLASLIGGVVNDAKDLLLHELTIAKLEIQSELHKTKEAAVSFAVGAGIAVAGGFLLLFMLVYLLAALTPIPLWGCYGVIGALLLGVGLVFLYRGKHTEEQLDEVLPQTTTTLKENAQWLKEQTTSNRA